jgi:hypothetical protein
MASHIEIIIKENKMQIGVAEVSKLLEISVFDWKKIRFQALALFLALLLWSAFVFGGSKVTGLPEKIFGWLANISLISVVWLSWAGVAKMVKENLLGNKTPSEQAVLSFLKKNLVDLLSAPVVLFILLVLLFIFEYSLSAIGRLPWIGSVILGLLTIPMFFFNCVVIMLGTIGMKMMPSMIAVDETNPSATLRKFFEICLKQPIRLLVSAGLTVLVAMSVILPLLLLLLVGTMMTTGFQWTAWTNVSLFGMGHLSLGLSLFLFLEAICFMAIIAMLMAYPMVYAQAALTSIYLDVKKTIKRK